MDGALQLVVTAALAGGGASAAVVWLLRDWISTRLRASIQAEYDRKLEVFKHDLEVAFEDEVRRRKLYEDLSTSLEDVWVAGGEAAQEDLSLVMNRLFGLLALYAPDDVYLSLRSNLVDNGPAYAGEVKPIIYHALRKSLFGSRTSLRPADLINHLELTVLPPKESHGVAGAS